MRVAPRAPLGHWCSCLDRWNVALRFTGDALLQSQFSTGRAQVIADRHQERTGTSGASSGMWVGLWTVYRATPGQACYTSGWSEAVLFHVKHSSVFIPVLIRGQQSFGPWAKSPYSCGLMTLAKDVLIIPHAGHRRIDNARSMVLAYVHCRYIGAATTGRTIPSLNARPSLLPRDVFHRNQGNLTAH